MLQFGSSAVGGGQLRSPHVSWSGRGQGPDGSGIALTAGVSSLQFLWHFSLWSDLRYSVYNFSDFPVADRAVRCFHLYVLGAVGASS